MSWFGVVVIGSLPVITRRVPVSEWGQHKGKEVKEREKERSFKSIYFFFILFVLFCLNKFKLGFYNLQLKES